MIIQTRQGHAIESRAFALTDTVRWGYGGLRNLQTQVGDRELRGIPALSRAARLRAEAVANLRLYCWRGEGPDRERVDTVWQSRLFSNGPQQNATNPMQTRFTFWETVEESLAWHNEAYIWKNTFEGRVTDWWALHPAQVITRYEGTAVRYDVQVAPGYVDPVGRGPGRYKNLDSSTILAIRGHGQGGQIEANPLYAVFRDKLAATLGRQRHEARMWRRGTALQVAIEFPAGVSKDQADQWRESWRSNYEGTEGETTAVIGGGGQIKPIGMTATDAQFTELSKLTVDDAALIMAVPGNLLSNHLNTVRTDLEQDLATWLRFGLGPELGRIEDALYADQELFGGSQTYPEFDTDGFVRGDILTEQTVLQSRVQSGILLPDEARAILGYDDLPGGLGKIPQVTPVGGAPNATPLPLPKAKPGKPGVAPDADTKSLTIPSIELRVEQDMKPLAEVFDTHLAREARARADADAKARELEAAREARTLRHEQALRDVTSESLGALEAAQQPEIHVHVPETPVNVTVQVPEQPTPEVHIHEAPAEQMQIDFARDGYGLIKSATSKPKAKK